MDEARRFLRFVIPGALFAVETVIVLLFLRSDWLSISSISSLNGVANVGGAFAAVLMTGALGFLFSVIHHMLNWRLPGSIYIARRRWKLQCSSLDYSGMIKRLIARKKLKVHVLDSPHKQDGLKDSEVTRKVAYTILAALWYEGLHQNPIKKADAKTDRMNDLTHSAGTACVASIAAMIVAFLIAFSKSDIRLQLWPIVGFVAACVVGFGFIWVFCETYIRVGQMTQSVLEQVLLSTFVASTHNKGNTGMSARDVYICKTSLAPNDIWISRCFRKLKGRWITWTPNEVTRIEYRDEYRYHIVFDDGTSGDVDFLEYFDRRRGFAPLRNLEFFKQARIEGGTIAWPNGADIAPESLYEKIVKSQQAAEPRV